MKSFLALSLGTYCGWARLDVQTTTSGTIWANGTWVCNGTPEARLQAFRYYLDQQLDLLGVDKLFVYSRAGQMLTALTEACSTRGLLCQPLNIVQVRQFATGSGRSDIVALGAAVRAWGFTPNTSSSAIAIACLKYAREEAG